MASSAPPLSRLGPYAIERELGRGGMATVYEGVHTVLGRRVAIKVIGEGTRDNPVLLARFTREARLLAKLRHPHIVEASEVDTYEGRSYFVMGLLVGPTLSAHVRACGGVGLPLAEVVEIFLPLTAAVAAAHAAGVVHRDLKPSNVLLATRSARVHPTVLDFGISTSGDFEDEQTLTRSGTVLGTVSYLSPEQTRGAKYATPASDQYALGVMLYECATGQLPFRGESAYETMHAIVTEDARPPSTVCRDLPGAFDAIVLRAMHKEPSRRFPSVAELGRALLSLADERTRAIWHDELVASASAALPVGANQPMDSTFTDAPPAAAPREEPRPSDARPIPSAPPSRGPRWRRAVPALLVLALGGGAAALFARGRSVPAVQSEPVTSERRAVLALAGPDARLACPIFEVRGVRDVGVRLGAAAATLACARTNWELGGRDDRVLPPAVLLDVPRQPVVDFADPYEDGSQRAHTLDLARARAAAYLDGVVTYDHDWAIELVARAADDREISRAQARDTTFFAAMKKALDLSWKPPLVRRPIEPDVTRWTSLDYALGVTQTNNELLDSPDGCDAMRLRARALGNAFFPLERQCEVSGSGATVDAETPRLDESSPEALTMSAQALVQGSTSLAVGDARRLAAKLDTMREGESSPFGRARISLAAAALWNLANEPEPAHASVLLSLREDPLEVAAWHQLVTAAGSTGSMASAAGLAGAWFPNETRFLAKAASDRGDELPARLRDADLAYALEPGFDSAVHFGRALAEAGRADEVRALAATPLEGAEDNRVLKPYLLALIDLHDGKLGRAIGRLEDAGNVGMLDLIDVAEVAGRGREVATAWAVRFLSLPEDEASMTARGFDAPMVLCMRARSDLATRCLERVARLGHAAINWWGDGGDALLAGAGRYAKGDVKGAVAAWRPLVAGPNLEAVRVLPTEAFERAGEADLATRLDARRMPFTFIAGVSEAEPRAAMRALAAGDSATARKLAQRVIAAWEVADISVPAVSKMRTVLASTPP